MDTKKVTKVPAAMEDLACGTNKVMQQRAGQDVEVHEIDMHLQVSSEDDIRKIDISKYTYAKIGEVAYRFDSTAISGIPSDFGQGFWNVSYLPSKYVSYKDESVEKTLNDILLELNNQSDAVAKNKKVFSAKVVKTASGWSLEDSNKVMSVSASIKPGARVDTLSFILDKKPVSLLSVGLPGFLFDYQIKDNELELALLHNLSGIVALDNGAIDLYQHDLWSSIIDVNVDSNLGEVKISHPDSFNTVSDKVNPYFTPGSISIADSIDADKFYFNAMLKSSNATKYIYAMAPLEMYVSYESNTDSFSVNTLNLNVEAVKGTISGDIKVSHDDLQCRPYAEATSDSLIPKVRTAGTGSSIVSLYNFSGTKKSDYDDYSSFALVSPSLVRSKCVSKSRVNFDFGPIVLPPSELEVGFSFYIVGLIEA